MIVRELLTKFGFEVDTGKIKAYNEAVDKAKAAATGASHSVTGMGAAAQGAVGPTTTLGTVLDRARAFFGKTGSSAVAAGQHVEQFARHAKHAEGVVQSFAHHLLGMAAVWLSFEGVKRVVEGIVEVNAKFQTLRAGLVTATGSEKVGGEAFEEIKRFAATTPYTVGQLVAAYTKLRLVGLDPSTNALRAYGNIAGSMGKPMDQLVEAIAHASVGMYRGLTAFGILAHAHGDKVKITFKGVTKEIGKDAQSIQKYMQDMGNKDFAGGIERQLHTLPGLWSNIVDNAEMFAQSVGKGGLADALMDAGLDLAKLLGTSEEAGETLGTVLGGAVRGLVDGVKTLAGWLDKGAKAIGGWDRVGHLAAAALELMIAKAIGLQALAFVSWVNKATAALVAFDGAALLAAVGPTLIGLAIAGIVLVIQDLYTYLTGGDAALGKTWDAWVGWMDAIRIAVLGAVTWIRDHWSGMLTFLHAEVLLLKAKLSALWFSMTEPFRTAWGNVVDFWSQVWTNIYTTAVNWIEHIKAAIRSIPGVSLIANIGGAVVSGAAPPTAPMAGVVPAPAFGPPPAPGAGAGNTTHNSLSVGKVEVHVPTGTDGHGVGNAAADALGETWRRLGNHGRTGLVY